MTEIKALLRDLRPTYIYDLKDKEDIITFIRGVNFGRKNHNLTQFIQAYLKEKHQIECFYMNWQEAVDAYAARKDKTFCEGFQLLLKEIFASDYDPVIDNSFLRRNFVRSFKLERRPLAEGKQLDSILLDNGKLIKVGDWCQLADKMGDAYQQTKFFDCTLRDPDWELFYPSEKDFKYVRFVHSPIDLYRENEKGEKQYIPASSVNLVRRLLSNYWFQIEKIIETVKGIFLYSKYFEVDVENAINNDELHLNLVEPKISISTSFLEDLVEAIESYEIGIMDNQLAFNDWYFSLINYSSTKELPPWCQYRVHGSWTSRKV